MKKNAIFFSFIFVFLNFQLLVQNIQAQTRSVEVINPGTLYEQLATNRPDTITDLAVSGLINAKDFKIIRDSLSSLKHLDLGGAYIQNYSGKDGTYTDGSTYYMYYANEIPVYAFYNSVTKKANDILVSIILPRGLNSLNSYCFAYCSALDTLYLSRYISQLNASSAFVYCSANIVVDPDNSFSSSRDGVLFDKDENILIHYPTQKKGKYQFPSSVTTLGELSFSGCSEMDSLELSSKIISIQNLAFINCKNLRSIRTKVLPEHFSLGGMVFYGVDKDSCILTVPHGTASIYQSSPQWSDFKQIRESDHGLTASKSSLNLNYMEGVNNDIVVWSDKSWRIHSNQTWVEVIDSIGLGDKNISLRFKANPESVTRKATLTLSADGYEDFVVQLVQAGKPLTVQNTAGNLFNEVSNTVLANTVSLILTGEMDARDFRTIRTYMTKLEYLDLSGVHILTYTGTDGTVNSNLTYPENGVPKSAFDRGFSGNNLLKHVLFPGNLSSIGASAFNYCVKLDTVVIPSTVHLIEGYAFSNCLGINSFNLMVNSPDSITVGSYPFSAVPLSNITLTIPYGTLTAYSTAKFWKDFSKIMENSDYLVTGSTKFIISESGQDSVILDINSNLDWELSTPQDWIHLKVSTGSGKSTLYFSVDGNSIYTNRTGYIRIKNPKTGYRFISIVQIARQRILATTAGRLEYDLTSEEKNTTINLKLTGVIDARDFLIMRDKMPNLNKLDLSQINIAAYSGTVDPQTGIWIDYPKNEIPQYAFKDFKNPLSLILPETASSIGIFAFNGATGLKEIVLPGSVTKILNYAFSNNPNLKSIELSHNLENIGFRSFYKCSGIKYISIPDNVKYIEGYAFSDCNLLDSIQFGKGLISIGSSAFLDCTSLKNIQLPSGMQILDSYGFSGCISLESIQLPGNIQLLANSAFSGCKALTSIDISSSLKMLGDLSFAGCSSLNSVKLPASMKAIGVGCFTNCTSLVSITLPDSLTKISGTLFSGCSKLESVHVPLRLDTIDMKAFNNCKSLKEIDIRNTVSFINYAAFSGCSSLEKVTLPDHFKSVGYYMFANCSSLKEFRVKDSVTYISSNAFDHCTSLKKLTLGLSVNQIDDFAFSNCTSLDSIIVLNYQPVVLSTNTRAFQGIDTTKCILYVPYGSRSMYASSNIWKNFKNIVEDPRGVSIDKTQIKLSNTDESRDSVLVSSNGNWTAKCNQTWINLTPSASFGSGTFVITAEKNNSSQIRYATVSVIPETGTIKTVLISQKGMLKSMSITKGKLADLIPEDELGRIDSLKLSGILDATDFKTIRDKMFHLEYLDLSDATIGSYWGTDGTYTDQYTISYPQSTVPQCAFYNPTTNSASTLLQTILLPKNCAMLGQNAFSKLNVHKLSLPENLRTISDYAFQDCLISDSIVLPSSVSYIGNSAFDNCSNLKKINIPFNVTFLGTYTFNRCSSLTDIDFASGTTSIPNFFANNCISLKKIEMPAEIKSIGINAFANCTRLNAVKFSDKVETISSEAFLNCNSIDFLRLPASLINIRPGAFVCPAMKTLYINRTIPPVLDAMTEYFMVNKDSCILYVPLGTKTVYENANEWKEFKNILEFDMTGLHNLQKIQLKLYPNPCNEEILISGSSHGTVLIYSLEGRKLMEETFISGETSEPIRLNRLNSGTYLYRVISEKENSEGILIKK